MDKKEKYKNIRNIIKGKRPCIKPDRLVRELERYGCEVLKRCKKHHSIVRMPDGSTTVINHHPSHYTVKRLEQILKKALGKRVHLAGA